MDIRKQRIDNKIYDVCTLDNYLSNPDMYDTSLTAIELDGYAYPLRSKFDYRPGIYVGGVISTIIRPTENISQYNIENAINFNDIDSIRDIMNKDRMVKDLQNEILCNGNNITHFEDDPDDKPIMKGLKEAWNKKHADFDSYSQRIGPNFNNDKRLFNKHDISLGKCESICSNTDIKMTVIFEDMSPDVPNPIGEPVVVVLNGEDENNV